MLRFQCPHCLKQFQVEPDLSGKQAACPHCMGHVMMPAAPLAQENEVAETASASQDLPGPIPQAPAVVAPISSPDPPEIRPASQRGDRSVSNQPAAPDPMAPVLREPALPGVRSWDASLEPTPVAAVESGAKIVIEDRPQTIHHKGRVIPLRRLTPEEKKRRRVRRTLLLILVSGAILIFCMLYGAGKI